jgi:predicted acetyltransferase
MRAHVGVPVDRSTSVPLQFRTPEIDREPDREHAVSTLPRPGLDNVGTRPDDLTTAYDGETCVGHLGSHRIDVTLPGDVRLTAAAITEFGVEPSHRRQGVLTGLMTTTLRDAHARGQVLATLSSPISALHPRFGFGLAADACTVEVDARAAAPIHRPALGSIDVMSVSDAAELVPDVYDRCARGRVGTVSRGPSTWARRLGAVPETVGATRPSVAFHLDSTGLADGYVQYDIATDADGVSVGVIRDLWGGDSEIERALWEHLVSIDDVDTWRSPRRPADDPVRFAMADVRAYRTRRRFDEQWIRLLDVDVALGTRTYNASTSAITLRVLDPMLSANTGTWRVDAYGSFRSQGDADFEIGIETLSAVYLGGTSFQELRDAGRLVERRSGAAGDADTLFASRPRPFCGTDT